MTAAATYNRQFSFTNYQAVNPSIPLPGDSVDIELNAVKTTLDAVLANLALIQRDDGALANDSVGLDQLSSEVTVGFSVPTVWVTATAYTTSNTVFHGSAFYRCLITHTAGVFATDLTALKWELIADLSTIATVSATQVAVTPSGNLTTNVQTSLTALDAAKAATSHTHPAANISDSTSAGRAFLTAADLAAQKTLLGLGSLAFLSSVPLVAASAQFGFTGELLPSALASNTNDWAPTNYATSAIIKFSASSAINLTGFLACSNGDIKILHNTGTKPVTLTPNDTASAAANRFVFAGPVVLAPNTDIALQYDATSATIGWRKLAITAADPRFQAQLAKSGANLVLSRLNGSFLFINGANEQIPAAGVTLAPPATTLTLYYIYAYMSSGVMTLEASATAYAIDANYGHQTKSGDATRTLVGMGYTSSSAWVDTATQRFVRSYFNDPGASMSNAFTAARSTTSASYAEVNSEIRLQFLVWTGETIRVYANGSAVNTGGNIVASSIGFNGTTAEDTVSGAHIAGGSGANNGTVAVGLHKSGLTEGFNYATLLGKVDSNTGTWDGSGTAGTRTTMNGFLRR